MTTTTVTDEGLAILTGQVPDQKPVCPPRPPTSDATERRLIEYHGARHGIFMANGTVTLQAALAAMGVGPGDEVIIPALTWMATAMAAHYLGAIPVFVDVQPDTLCLDPAPVEEAVTPRTKAIIPVHLYGSMTDMDAILAIARRHGLAVIEDCAHMQGGKWAGRGVGSWGHVGSFSFQQSKTLASGEGGICITSDDRVAETLYRIKHIGYALNARQGTASSGPPLGLVCHNFRATEFQAAILDGQLSGLEALIARYEANAAVLTRRIADVQQQGLRVQARGRRASPQGYYAFVTLADQGPLGQVPIDILRKAIAAEGLNVGGTYGPVYRHTLWSLRPQQYRIAGGSCPVAEGIATGRSLVFLHPWLGADDASIQRIGDIFTRVAMHATELQALAQPDRPA
jgi:L-glutamine:2-deoxy-scyllo-inosose/3-amino-2,3-dideoxy-scyllo-inosose aminotransferase